MLKSKTKTGKKITAEDIIKDDLSSRSEVIVNIWTSGANPKDPGENVGHVSLMLVGDEPPVYMSFWPKLEWSPYHDDATKGEEGKGIHKAISSEWVPDFDTEVDFYEHRMPELQYSFYTLDYDAMKQKFRDEQVGGNGWCVFGDLWKKDAESCASMVWKILLAGGLQKLLGHLTISSIASKAAGEGSKAAASGFLKGSSSKGSQGGSFYSSEGFLLSLASVKSPDMVAEALERAQEVEGKKHKEILTIEDRKTGRSASFAATSTASSR